MWNETLEELIVVKRSGQRVEFNASKIAIAVKKAFDAVYDDANEKQIYKIFEKVLNYINKNYYDRKTINVEDIQDIIEKTLKEESYENVYNSFKEYRNKRAASRKVFNEKQQHKFVKAIEKVQEEGSKGSAYLTPIEVLNKFGKIISSEYTKSYVLDTKYVRALEEGNIYVHNLDFFSLGFMSHVNLKINVKDESDCIDSLINEIINVQEEVSDEIGINSLDVILEKSILNNFHEQLIKYLKKYFKLYGILELICFKKYEDAIKKINDINEAYDLLSSFMINSNFENIIRNAIDDALFDTYEIIKRYVNKIFVILLSNLKVKKKINISLSYNESKICLLVRDEVISYLNSTKTLDNINVIFKIIKELDDAYLLKIINLIINQKNISLSFPRASYNIGYDDVEYFSNGYRVFENINDNYSSSNGRMLLATTSINLARIALKNKNRDYKSFYEELDQILELTKNELLLMFETYGNKNKENYKFLFNGNITYDEKLEDNQKIRKVIKNGALNLGVIGLMECVMLLETEDEKRYDLTIQILEYLNNKCQKFSEDNKVNFSLCEANDMHARKSLIAFDKSIYGFIKNITDKDSYDLIYNSKFINEDFNKIANIQKLLNGGSFLKIEVSNRKNNKYVLELIKRLIDADIGYVKLEVSL